jgi:Peptidase family M23
VNTHFEVDNLALATDQAAMVIDEIKKINTENLMVIVTGDFNSGPAVGPPVSFKNAGYTYTKEGATTTTNEDYATFNDYKTPYKGRHIDYIYVKNNNADVTINTFEVLIETPGGVIPSDHNAIVAGLLFAGTEDGASDVAGGNPSLYCTDEELKSKEIYWPVKDPAPINTHDLPKPVGTPVYAITSGVVVESKDLVGCDGRKCGDGMYSYGRVIKIDHGLPKGKITYAHLSERQVEVGDRVAAGQQIALSGNSGNSYGPHLHVDFNSGSYTVIPWLRTKSPLEPKGDICTQ